MKNFISKRHGKYIAAITGIISSLALSLSSSADPVKPAAETYSIESTSSDLLALAQVQ